MSRLPAQGELSRGSLPRLLMDLHAARFQGALVLSRDSIEKSFLFHEGTPVHAGSNRASESLGAQLRSADVLSEADHSRLVATVRRERCPEAKAILSLGLLDPKALFLALKEQIRLRLLDCFGWNRGGFELRPDVAPPEGAQALGANLYAIVQEGIEIHWSSEQVLADLSPHMALYPTRAHGLAGVASGLELDESVESLLTGLGGERTLWQLVRDVATPRALAAAWVLDAAGAIAYREAPVGTGPAEAAPQVEIVVTAGARDRGEAPPGEAPRAAAAAVETKGRSAAAAEIARQIAERFERLDELDHYALLEIERNAESSAIKGAYLAAAKSYHPDVIARSGLDTDTRVRANKVFAEIGKAYATLSDPERRRQYDLTLMGGGEEIDAERLATAEGLFRKGEVLLRQGNFRGALEFLEPAVELWPGEAEYQSALGWVLYKKLPSEPERAREHLEAAAALDPSDESVAFRLSVVTRALDDR